MVRVGPEVLSLLEVVELAQRVKKTGRVVLAHCFESALDFCLRVLLDASAVGQRQHEHSDRVEVVVVLHLQLGRVVFGLRGLGRTSLLHLRELFQEASEHERVHHDRLSLLQTPGSGLSVGNRVPFAGALVVDQNILQVEAGEKRICLATKGQTLVAVREDLEQDFFLRRNVVGRVVAQDVREIRRMVRKHQVGLRVLLQISQESLEAFGELEKGVRCVVFDFCGFRCER